MTNFLSLLVKSFFYSRPYLKNTFLIHPYQLHVLDVYSAIVSCSQIYSQYLNENKKEMLLYLFFLTMEDSLINKFSAFIFDEFSFSLLMN